MVKNFDLGLDIVYIMNIVCVESKCKWTGKNIVNLLHACQLNTFILGKKKTSTREERVKNSK